MSCVPVERRDKNHGDNKLNANYVKSSSLIIDFMILHHTLVKEVGL